MDLETHYSVCITSSGDLLVTRGMDSKGQKKIERFSGSKRNRVFHGRNLKNININIGVLKCFLYLRFLTVYDFVKNKNLEILCLAGFLV